MMKAVTLEFFKIRHKHIFLMVLLFLSVEAGWAFMASLMSISRNANNAGWMPLIAMFSSMNGLFLPILSAVCVSRICDMEHKGDTWRLLLSVSVKRSQLYSAKFICAATIMLCFCILQIFAIAFFGIFNRFGQPVPVYLLIRFLGGIVLTNMVIITLQQWISLAVKNQIFALGTGMIGGFIGITADLFPSGVRKLFIWSYYSVLSPVAQSNISDSMQFIAKDSTGLMPAAAVLLLVGSCIYMLGNIQVSRQEL